jgi:hypothetical protein
MRNFGILALVLGILGFVYAGDQASRQEPLPSGLTAVESLSYPAGRWEAARFALAGLAGFGVLMMMFPKGR